MNESEAFAEFDEELELDPASARPPSGFTTK
jgi:hypothetical protein